MGWVSNANLADDSSSEEVVLSSEAETERVLGTVWLPEDNMLTFKIKMVISRDATQSKANERIRLIKLAIIFDPSGAATAVVIKLKVAIQKLW